MNQDKQCCNNPEQANNPDQSTDTESKKSCCSAGSCCAGMAQPNWQGILNQAKEVLTDPVNCWAKIKSEQKSPKEIYLSYLIPLAVLGAVAQILGSIFFGGPFGLVHSIAFSVVIGVLYLALFFVGGYIFSALANYFGGTVSQEDAFRLIAYSATASLAAGVLSIYPPIAIIGALFSLYGLYTLYSGIPAMTGITEKRLPYFVVSFLAYFMAGFVIKFVVVAALGLQMITSSH